MSIPTPSPSRIAVILGTSRRPLTPTSGAVSQSPSDEPPSLVMSDILPPRLGQQPEVPPSVRAPSQRTSAPATRHGTPRSPHTHAHGSGHPRPPATEPSKRRGRPVGWRPGMGPYSSRATFSDGPPTPQPRKLGSAARGGIPKRRGRRPGPMAGPPRATYERLRPKFISFLCEWEGCPAELQNLETLRKHVFVVHGRSDTCRWGKCARAVPPRSLPHREAFQRHMEDAHLVPFSWHVGDGPQNTSSVARVARDKGDPDHLPDYLFDEDGNQVTPSVINQEFENEDDRKLRRRRLHRLILQRERNAPEEEPESPVEELRSLLERA